jgi:flagellar hook assembly protein FlgD
VQEQPNSKLYVPARFTLHQNYPNPFNPVTVIQFEISKAIEVRIIVYNVLGERVKTLVSGYFPAGSSSVRWDGTNEAGIRVCSGIYVYQMTAGNTVITRRMILIK